MSTRRSNVMNYVIEDQKYYICKICGNRLEKNDSDLRSHLKKLHEIGPEDVVQNYASVPNKQRVLGFAMKEWVKSQFTGSDDQKKWQCTLCKSILIGPKLWMPAYEHLKDEHREILIPPRDDRSMPGSSSSTGNIIASLLSRNESPTAEMSSNFSVPLLNEFEELNENVHEFEAHMSVGDTEEDFLQNEDTIDLGNKHHKESRTSIANESEKLKVEVKDEITDDGDPTESVFSVSGNGTSDQHRSGRLNTQESHNSSTNDELNIKREDSEHEESDDEVLILDCESISSFGTQDSGRTRDIGTPANPSRSSSKRLSVTSTSHRTPAKRAKPNSSGTDPVDENSSRDADRPLPDSNTTSSSVSPETELLSITDRIIRSMSNEEKSRVIQAVLGKLYEK